MSLFLEELRTFLISQNIPDAGVTPWYTKKTPPDPDKVNVLLSYGGAPPEFGFGTPGLKYEHPGLQVRTRGEAGDEDEPEARIQKIYQELPKIQARTISIGGPVYQMLKPQQHPFKLEIDNTRVVWVVNFIVDKEMGPTS